MKTKLLTHLIIFVYIVSFIIEMESVYPIVVGSSAVKFHGYSIEPRDTDLIVTKSWKNPHLKTRNAIQFVDKKAYDVTVATEFMEKMFVRVDQLKQIEFPKIGKCYAASIEMLYAMYKSHIHRILPLTSSQTQNVTIWKKHVDIYNWLRDKCFEIVGRYDRLDEMTNKENDSIIYQLYSHGFDDVNERVGDTEVSMDVDKQAFFDDKVKRFVDHDELHKKVAGLFGRVPLFPKFQPEDTTTVGMDRVKFITAVNQDKVMCVVDEVIVLLLERKLLPELNLYKSDGNLFTGFKDKFDEYLLEIIAHFITNLCGSGKTAWLRNWCLDHMELIAKKEIYPLDAIERLALSIIPIQKQITVEKKEVKEEIPLTHQILYLKIKSKITKPFTPCMELDYDDDWVGSDIPSLNEIGYVHGSYRHDKSFDTHNCQCSKKYEITDPAKMISYIAEDRDCYILDLATGKGFYDGDCNESKLFNLFITYSDDGVSFSGTFEDDDFDGSHQRVIRSVYYRSRSCEFGEQVGSYHILGTYGSVQKELKPFCERIARFLLGIEKDDEEPNYSSIMSYNNDGKITYGEYGGDSSDSD